MAKGSAVATKEHEGQVQKVDDYADKYAGEGTNVDKEHTITPRVSILQGLSPQVKRNNVAYVEGAAPGMIYLSSYAEPLVEGEKGIVFQPCVFLSPWEVRTPKEAGAMNFVGQYDTPQEGWEKKESDKGFVFYKTPEGNIAAQVHIHVGLVHINDQVLPYAIKFSGTGMFISKQWNGLISSRRTESLKPAARFTYTYRMKVKNQSNSFGDWGQWAISPEGKATPEQMDLGHDLFMAFKEGKASVAADDPTDTHQPETDDDAM